MYTKSSTEHSLLDKRQWEGSISYQARNVEIICRGSVNLIIYSFSKVDYNIFLSLYLVIENQFFVRHPILAFWGTGKNHSITLHVVMLNVDFKCYAVV